MDDPMPVRHFERVRELLRDQERLCVASIEVSEQWRTQGGKKVKRDEYFKKIKPTCRPACCGTFARSNVSLGFLQPLILNVRLPSRAVMLDAF